MENIKKLKLVFGSILMVFGMFIFIRLGIMDMNSSFLVLGVGISLFARILIKGEISP